MYAACSLARLEQFWDRHEKAEEMYIRALIGYEKALGPDHTSTLRTVHNLGFVRNGQSFLEGILLRLFMVPAEIPRQYSSSQGWRQSPLTGRNDPTLHLDPA
jgi:Tetratricopeptide repeat